MKPSNEADRDTFEVENNSESGVAQQELFTNPQAVERRIWRSIFVIIALAVLISASVAPLKVTLGLAMGGALALLNFKWLHVSVRDILSAGTSKAPPGTMMLFIIRWLVVAIVIYGAYLTGYFDSLAMLCGLFAPALAVMVEAGYVTYKTIARSGERD